MPSNRNKIQREITPLISTDCLMVFDRHKGNFDFPVHFHPEYELNFICNAAKTVRIVGDHKEEIGEIELVLVGSNVYHGWINGLNKNVNIHEITIQFQNNLFDESLLERNMMKNIKQMLENSNRGILFSNEVCIKVAPIIQALSAKKGIEAYISLINLLNILSLSENMRYLCSNKVISSNFENGDQIRKVCVYIEKNFQEKIKVSDVALNLNITESTLARLLKNRTGRTFVEFLNDYRIGFACRWLTETDQTISEIAFRCGFYNIANFNRIFRKLKNLTPGEYRQNFSGVKQYS